MQEDRIRHAGLRDRVVDADHAAALIQPGETVAMSGFTGSGYPKAVPLALAARIEQAHAAGQPFQIKLMTGASTAPELDGALAKADAIALRMPFQSDPDARKRINDGTLDYIDIHTPMLGADGRPRAELFRADALHLNADGYALWKTVIAAHLGGPAPRAPSTAVLHAGP